MALRKKVQCKKHNNRFTPICHQEIYRETHMAIIKIKDNAKRQTDFSWEELNSV